MGANDRLIEMIALQLLRHSLSAELEIAAKGLVNQRSFCAV